ncbi:MAG TPA: hypothetical protein ENI81_03780 [Phycisphaerales bacterium]|nr:hypothetical protein [Phycisphaerales bacterium]
MQSKTTIQTANDNFISEVLRRFSQGNGSITEDITDRVFLMIQDDPQLCQEYHFLTDSNKSKRALNSRLGRRIREHFCLKNIGRCHSPKSRLIKSYERHEK